MNIIEFTQKYNLHDSLLEKIIVNADTKAIILHVDFCYWLQDSYKDGSPETGMIKITFNNATFDEYKPLQLNSNSILQSAANSSNEFLLTIEEKHTGCLQLKILAESVTVNKLGNG